MPEAAIVGHAVVQCPFAAVTERRVPDVVGEAEPFRERFVEAQDPRDTTRHLAHLEAVGEPGAVVVALVVQEDLGLVLEPTEGGGVGDSW